jgi:hypothetical protein
MHRTQFTFYESFARAIRMIPDGEERAAAYDAICDYVFYGTLPGDDSPASVRMIFCLVQPSLDASNRKAENGKSGGKKASLSKTDFASEDCGSKTDFASDDEESKNDFASEGVGSKKKKENKKENKKEDKCPPPISPPQGDQKPAERHKFGEYGWVRLSDSEYDRLVSEYGKDRAECAIKHIDEAAQSTGNKNRWKDWNLTVRRCIREDWDIKRFHSANKAPAPGSANPVSSDDIDRFFADLENTSSL